MQPLRVQIIIFAVEIIYVFLPSAYYNNPRYLHAWLFIEFTRIVRVIVWYNHDLCVVPLLKLVAMEAAAGRRCSRLRSGENVLTAPHQRMV